MGTTGNTYDVLSFWGSILQEHVVADGSDYVVDFLRGHDPLTCDGIRDLAASVVRALNDKSVPTTEDAVTLWQVSQCLKKFRYGGTPSPEEMMQGWVERNKLMGDMSGDPVSGNILSVLLNMKSLLGPLDEAFERVEANGHFGDGAVYEGYTTIARWNAIPTFSYDPRCPDDIRTWTDSPSLAARCECVPKDMFKLRSITVEPAEATFIQQLTRTRLIAAAAEVLPLSSAIPQQLWGAGPEVQQHRCLKGSLDGSLATIDLSDASDTIRWDIVQRVFPAGIVAELERSRSPYCEVGGTRYRVHMYAGMGNATTFIVESLYFWALFTALSRWVGIRTPVSVFGDDIVLDTRVARNPLVRDVVEKLGHRINWDKSGISSGPGFREACGTVAYCGEVLPLHRIRGYRPEKPEELVSMCGLISHVLDPATLCAPFFRNVMVDVGKQVVEDLKVPVLPEAPDRAGAYLVDPSEMIGSWSYKARWNTSWQVPEVRVRVLTARGKTREVRALSRWEALGVLRGQLHTEFNLSPIGYSSKKSRLTLMDSRYISLSLKPAWVPVSSSDASLLELGSSE